ncbi:MAG: AgmX/PglI C-terminal domain-containing protein [Pseudomonadota bacterium]
MAGTVLQAFIFRDGSYLGTEMLTGERIEIGRDPTCGLVIDDDDLVSRRHAALFVLNNQIYVEDLQSANGTQVNGEAVVGQRALGGRDDVFVGRHTLKLKILSASPAAMSTPPAAAAPQDHDATKVHSYQADQTIQHPMPSRAPTAPQQPVVAKPAPPRAPTRPQQAVAAAPAAPRAAVAPAQASLAPFNTPRSDPWRELSSSQQPDPVSGKAVRRVADPFAAPPPPPGVHDGPTEVAPGLADALFADVAGLSHGALPGAAPIDAGFEMPPLPNSMPGGVTDPLAALGDLESLIPEPDPAPVVERKRAPAPPTAAVAPPVVAPPPAAPPVIEPTAHAAVSARVAASAGLASVPATPAGDVGALPLSALMPLPGEVPEADEDEDPDDLPAPFSLLENLLKESFKEGKVKQLRTPLLEVIRYKGNVVHELEALGKGQLFIVGKGLNKKEAQRVGLPTNHKLARLRRDGSADLVVLKDFKGKVRQNGSSKPLDQVVSWSGDKGAIKLNAGDIANLQVGSESYFVRFAYPPAVARQVTVRGKSSAEEKRELRWLGISFASSGATHLTVLLVAFIIGLLAPGQLVTQLEEDRFVQLEQKELELEKPPEEEPPPDEEVVEEAPPEEIKPEKPQRTPRPTNANVANKKPGIMAALGKIPKMSGPAGSQTLTAAVSNLDAVKVPGGGSSYKVSGLIGKGPTNRVQIGGSGGGVSTKGLASILREGGGGPGTLSKLKTGGVRGKLVKASRASKTAGTGYLDRAEIQKVVNKGLGQIQFCYEKELLKNNSLSGKVVFEWTIGLNGSVQIVKTTTSTLKSATAVQCMIGSIKGWKFPAPRGGTVVVTYPFIFNAMGF